MCLNRQGPLQCQKINVTYCNCDLVHFQEISLIRIPILSEQCCFARRIIRRARAHTMQISSWQLLTSNFTLSLLFPHCPPAFLLEPMFSLSSVTVLRSVQHGALAASHIFISGPRCFCKINACCIDYYQKTVARKSFRSLCYPMALQH